MTLYKFEHKSYKHTAIIFNHHKIQNLKLKLMDPYIHEIEALTLCEFIQKFNVIRHTISSS